MVCYVSHVKRLRYKVKIWVLGRFMFIGAVGGGGSLILMEKSRQYFIRGLIPHGTSIDGNEKATISKG